MINVRAKNFTLTDAIKSHTEEKMDKFTKFLDEGEKIDVVLDVDQNRHKVLVYFTVAKEFFKAEESHDDLYAAVDLVVDKIQKQIRRHLDKTKSKDKESIRFGDFPNDNGVVNGDSKEDKANRNEDPRIVRRKVIPTKPMFEEEAIAQMELLGHRSFIFYNASTDVVSMLYKRHDGDYGIIES